MKKILEKFIGKNIYSIYSFGKTNYDYKNQKISFESELFTHLINDQIFFCFKIEPVFIFEFDYFNLSKISIENHVEKSSIYSDKLANITRCVLATTKKIKKIIVYGFPINKIINCSFGKTKPTTENFILFQFEDNEKIFFDTSYEISSVTLFFEELEIRERINKYGLIEAYCLE